MQFIKNGPDIPERLLHAHEEGRVVFFCGAGISRPAGLPDFEELVKKIYEALSPKPNATQRAAIKAKRFDIALGLLEGADIGRRERVRQALADILLAPKLSARNAMATHEAMLMLGKGRDDQIRLVTTNFDRLFEEVIAAKSPRKLPSVNRFEAPLLPIPKRNWDGLVYLHGLLNQTRKESELDRLVVSSGDFGLAYLTERWASRFVSELFRNYIVCFVGYSIDDPILRYMTDALAADRLLGESTREMFAFGCYSKGKEIECAEEWKSKNVIPIPYRAHYSHAHLHKTLRNWAETYRDGVSGKEYLVLQNARTPPGVSTKQDNLVGGMLWALSDSTGLPAKRFAERNPVPSLDWLSPLSEERFGYGDLDRFGVPPKVDIDKKLKFGLIRRPSPYTLAPDMSVVDMGARGSRWDEVMWQLARWLIRHLNDPALLLWLAGRGGQLHENLIYLIENRLKELTELDCNGKKNELAQIRADAPNAIPGPLMRTLWQFLLTGRVKSRIDDFNFYHWRDHLRQDGLTTSLRVELRKALTPCVTLSKPYPRLVGDNESREPERIGDLVECKIELETNQIRGIREELQKDEHRAATMPGLLSDFSLLLRDVLDLMCELGEAGYRSDLSRIYQPSISEHPQNRNFRDWTLLIELTREAWLAMAVKSPERASLLAETWWRTPYPLFRRLAFFAAAQSEIISPRRALDWLLADERWWLWSVETQREVMRLLVALAPRLDDVMQAEVECAILAGPPRRMFRDDIESERWEYIKDRNIWLRLAKLKDPQGLKTSAGRDQFDALSKRYPDWRLEPDQREEFPAWMEGPVWVGSTGENVAATPHHARELAKWLRQHREMDISQPDDWQQRCRDDFVTVADALCALAEDGLWPISRWAVALQEWSDEKHIERSWHRMGSVLRDSPQKELQDLAHSISTWLRSLAKTIEVHDNIFFALVRRLLELDYDDDDFIDHEDPLTRSMNRPVGCVTEALVSWWYRQSPQDEQGLPEELKQTFTRLCDFRISKFRYGRTILALHIISLFRVDQDWVTQNLLPLFDWPSLKVEGYTEARWAWGGFLWAPRLYRPLMEVLKSAFLDTAHHYEELGERGEAYAALLTFASLDRGDTFTIIELVDATHALPLEGLYFAAQALVDALESTGDQREDYWNNRVKPYLRKIWPSTTNKLSESISEEIGLLCVVAMNEFPEALELLHSWLQPLDRPEYLVRRLHKADHCQNFPGEALEFLSRIIGDQTQWPPGDLGACLEAIRTAAPKLEDDPRYEWLMTYARRHGMGSN